MAAAAAGTTAHKICVNPENTGLWKVKQTDEASNKVSELLQEDLEKHHVFFNEDGFHNHVSRWFVSTCGDHNLQGMRYPTIS
jgi:hypothetical protein